MSYRIITHGCCNDGFASAFVFKRFWKYFVPELTKEDIDHSQIIGLQARDIGANKFKFTKKDIVLDLPRPKNDIYFWCDHHSSNKLDNLSKRNHWGIAPSNTGLLLTIAQKNGLLFNEEIESFKTQVDIMDSASYTKEMIQECYYDGLTNDSPSDLLKVQMICSIFHTKNWDLNNIMFKKILENISSDTPLTSKEIWQLEPQNYHKKLLANYNEWRETVGGIITYDELAKCTIQDERLIIIKRGAPDRFYSVMKFPQTSYSLMMREKNTEVAIVSIGSNIFNPELCVTDIGDLCENISNKFGNGVGGGHKRVGAASIDLKNYDTVKDYILESLIN